MLQAGDFAPWALATSMWTSPGCLWQRISTWLCHGSRKKIGAPFGQCAWLFSRNSKRKDCYSSLLLTRSFTSLVFQDAENEICIEFLNPLPETFEKFFPARDSNRKGCSFERHGPGVNLREKVGAFITDGSKGCEKTLKMLFPKVPLVRDLRHIQVNCRKLPRSVRGPDIATASYLSAEVNFTAYLPSARLFSHVWEQVMYANAEKGLHSLNHYIGSELLRWKVTWLMCWPQTSK